MQGVVYTKAMMTGWKPPAKLRKRSEAENQAVRDKFHILVDGANLPPPITEFEVRVLLFLLHSLLESMDHRGLYALCSRWYY